MIPIREQEHLSKQYHQDLEYIRSNVLMMGGKVEQQFMQAIEALNEGDVSKAENVMLSDVEINQLEVTLDHACTNLIVRRQPAANDLRTVMAATKVISDLERVGDEVIKIARSARNMEGREAKTTGYDQALKVIADTALRMLHDALDAFARLDKELAIRLIGRDALIDHEFHVMMRDMIDSMKAEPVTISSSLDILWAAKAIERIGDHSTNIAEQVIYIVEGTDVRHTDYAEIVLGKADAE